MQSLRNVQDCIQYTDKSPGFCGRKAELITNHTQTGDADGRNMGTSLRLSHGISLGLSSWDGTKGKCSFQHGCLIYQPKSRLKLDASLGKSVWSFLALFSLYQDVPLVVIPMHL